MHKAHGTLRKISMPLRTFDNLASYILGVTPIFNKLSITTLLITNWCTTAAAALTKRQDNFSTLMHITMRMD